MRCGGSLLAEAVSVPRVQMCRHTDFRSGEVAVPPFLIAMTAEGDTWAHLSEPEQQRLISQCGAGVEGLRSRGVYRHGAAVGEADVVSSDGSTTLVPVSRITGSA